MASLIYNSCNDAMAINAIEFRSIASKAMWG
jgi:hypothetical protein